MAFQPVYATAQVFVQFTTHTVIHGFTLFYTKGTGYSESDLQDLADYLDPAVASELMPYLSLDCHYDQVEVRGLEEEEDYVKTANASAVAGTLTGQAAPNNCAFVIKRTSGYTGRSARGRIYIGGLSMANFASDENFMNATYPPNWINALDEFDTIAIGLGWAPVIVSRYHEGAKRAAGVIFGIDGWSYTDLKVDTQRRRLP